MEVVPTLEAMPHNQFVGHKAVFINEPKLSDFKLVLLQEGIQAEFIAGVLICNNNVAVRRVRNKELINSLVVSLIRRVLHRVQSYIIDLEQTIRLCCRYCIIKKKK